MEGVAVYTFQIQLIQEEMKRNKNFIHIQVMKMNKVHMIHMLTWLIYLKFIDLGPLVFGMSTVWEDTDDYEKAI